jgi:hypothetical protein
MATHCGIEILNIISTNFGLQRVSFEKVFRTFITWQVVLDDCVLVGSNVDVSNSGELFLFQYLSQERRTRQTYKVMSSETSEFLAVMKQPGRE